LDVSKSTAKSAVKKMLPRPKPNEVKIWFQGSTGSGKTLLADLIRAVLKARGLTVRDYQWGSGVPMENQIVDLTQQNITDVLTVDLERVEDVHKLYFDRGDGRDVA
jgi:thymidylate kinase